MLLDEQRKNNEDKTAQIKTRKTHKNQTANSDNCS